MQRDVVLPALAPAFVASGAIAFATAMGAFGTAFTLATNIDVLPMLIYTEFTLSANIAISAALSVGLGLVTWASSRWPAVLAAAPSRRPDESHARPPDLYRQLLFTLLVAAFLFVPAVLSIMAGVTVNYFRGIQLRLHPAMGGAGLGALCRHDRALVPDRLRNAGGHAGRRRSGGLCAACAGQGGCRARSRRSSRCRSRFPASRSRLALLLTYGGFGDFRRSWLFILVGHVVFTCPSWCAR